MPIFRVIYQVVFDNQPGDAHRDSNVALPKPCMACQQALQCIEEQQAAAQPPAEHPRLDSDRQSSGASAAHRRCAAVAM